MRQASSGELIEVGPALGAKAAASIYLAVFRDCLL